MTSSADCESGDSSEFCGFGDSDDSDVSYDYGEYVVSGESGYSGESTDSGKYWKLCDSVKAGDSGETVDFGEFGNSGESSFESCDLVNIVSLLILANPVKMMIL